ncbi:MAG: hypoxanthine-guanine phosphoribosyltransferase [Gammaproteobacteria bacterium]|nr:hypoxanthine-guanine phosphoribosyltransferase [Gammaproteobacteria bacterium]
MSTVRRFQGAPGQADFEAELLVTSEQVQAAYDRMAVALSALVADRFPLFQCVMVGGLIPCAQLLQRLSFPLQLDYLHATRYQGGTRGAELEWKTRPTIPVAGRTVVVVDDILDEGLTLEAIVNALLEDGAKQVLTVVLADKQLDKSRALQAADVTGLRIPDRYVFGCGMDVHGLYRELPDIYALCAV